MDLNRLRQLSGQRPLYESVQSVPGIGKKESEIEEEFSVDDIDGAQNDIDLDQSSQFTEQAQVVSCNQDNPASVVDACAMDTSTVVNEAGQLSDSDKNFIIPSIEQVSMYARTMEELVQMVSKETGYQVTPEFVQFVKQAHDKYMGIDGEFDQEEDDYTDASMRSGEMGMEEGVNEAYDMQNGYKDVKVADGQDYFPNGADSPVVDKVGPSGARQGDNPEQKKMEVTETHKELVYNYRKFLKESAKK